MTIIDFRTMSIYDMGEAKHSFRFRTMKFLKTRLTLTLDY